MIANQGQASRFRKLVSIFAPGPDGAEDHVHFHRGPQGAPAACHDSRCASPRLEL